MSAHEWFQLSCQQTINYPGCPFCNSWSGQSGKFIPVVFLTTGTDFSTTTTVGVDRRNLVAPRRVVVRSRCRALGFKIDDYRISTQLEIAAQMIFAPLCVRLQGLPDDERNFWPNVATAPVANIKFHPEEKIITNYQPLKSLNNFEKVPLTRLNGIFSLNY